MINIIKSGVGNIGSIIRVLDDLEIDYKIINSPNDFTNFPKIVLPGVGSYDSFMKSIKDKDLFKSIKIKVLEENFSILGICVGMQSLFESSDEGKERGFGFIKGNCVRFKSFKNYKVPHLGWNEIDFVDDKSLFKNVKSNLFYFAHSFYVNTQEYELSSTFYINNFSSSVNYKKIYGVQFHPEKSYKQGKKILENFIKLC
tara:strand:+ start:15 stop:614 length:600 start_codon:yes stop_codon:yes gene_type:complete